MFRVPNMWDQSFYPGGICTQLNQFYCDGAVQ